MSVKERIEVLQRKNDTEIQPCAGVCKVLTKSKIEDAVGELETLLVNSRITKEVHEDGNRMYIEIIWPKNEQNEFNRIVISVRENSVKFIGTSEPMQFIELQHEDVYSKEMVEESLAETFFHPSIINKNW